MPHHYKPTYLYSVYRNEDDRLMALDVSAAEAMKIMGITKKQTLYRFFWRHGGNGRFFTVTKKTIKEIEEETNA